MATVQTQVGEVTGRHASAVVLIDNGRTVREYQLFVGLNYVSVATGNAIRLRSPGKTFRVAAELRSHYKTDGETLYTVAAGLKRLIRDAMTTAN